jgi:hypothetical protein
MCCLLSEREINQTQKQSKKNRFHSQFRFVNAKTMKKSLLLEVYDFEFWF